MWPILLELIKQLNSSVFVLIIFVIIVCSGLYKTGKWTGKWKTTFKFLDEKIKHNENLAEKVIKIETKIDLIYDHTLGSKRPVASMSPIMLTEVGKEIVKKINGNDILNRCIYDLVREVETDKPNNAYDIQMISMRVAKEKMISCLNDNELLVVKQEAYNRGLLVEDIMSVFGVLLRDYILKQKGLPINDVDKHDPAKNKK